MPYVDPQSVSNPTTGQPILASWGDSVRDQLQYLSGGYPHCSIKETTAQAITTATDTPLTSNEENSDIGGMHSTSTNTSRITVPAGEGGLYALTALVSFASDATGIRFLAIFKNGVGLYTLDSRNAVNGGTTNMSGPTSMVLAAGDYVECVVQHTKGSNLNCTLLDFSVRWAATA